MGKSYVCLSLLLNRHLRLGVFFVCFGSWTNEDLYAWGICVYNNKTRKPVYNFESDGI